MPSIQVWTGGTRRTQLAAVVLLLLLTPGGAAGRQDATWSPVAPPLVPRYEAQVTAIGGRLYAFGGFTEHAWPVIYATDHVAAYDPGTDTWAALAPMPTPVTHAGCAAAGNEAWVVGGFLGDHPGEATALVQVYDAQSDAWRLGPPLPEARAAGALARVGRSLHYFGGLLPDRDSDVDDHFVLDLDDETAGWRRAAPLPEARNHLGGVALAGRVYAIGGQHGHDSGRTFSTALDVYDPLTGAWEARAPLPIGRSHFEPGTFVHDGHIVIVGGVGQRRQNQPGTDLITAYDPGLDVWVDHAPLPLKLLAPGARVFGDALFVTGGALQGGERPMQEAWRRAKERARADTLGFYPDRSTIVGGGSTSVRQEVVLWTLNGETPAEVQTSAPWLRATLSGTVDTGGAAVLLEVDTRALANGTYETSVIASAAGYPDAVLPVQVVVSGSTVPVERAVPQRLGKLESPFPNPTTGSVSIRFQGEAPQPTRLVLHDALGRLVRVLYHGTSVPGAEQLVTFETSTLPNGTYLVRLQNGAFQASDVVVVRR